MVWGELRVVHGQTKCQMGVESGVVRLISLRVVVGAISRVF